MPPVPKHRESLLAASARLFQRQGYAATGLSEILAASGAPKGSLYHYYPEGKEAIADEALRTVGAGVEKRLRDATVRSPDPGEFVVGVGRALAHMMAESGFSNGCQVATVALEAAPKSARLTAATRDILGSWCAAIADMLVGAGIAPQRAAELADLAVSGFQGALILARVRQSVAPIDLVAAELARLFNTELSGVQS